MTQVSISKASSIFANFIIFLEICKPFSQDLVKIWPIYPITDIHTLELYLLLHMKPCLLVHRPIKVALRSKIRKAILIYD